MPAAASLSKSQPLLIQLLLEKEILTPEQVEGLNEARSKDHGSLESILVKKGLVMDQHIAEVYADYLMVPLFDMAPERDRPAAGRPAARKALPRALVRAGGAARATRWTWPSPRSRTC